MLAESVQSRESLATGTLIGERYKIVAPLARGGFGAVYVAEQIATERRVALKILLPQFDGVSVERLLTEARIPSRVNSEHIVQVIDAGIDSTSSAVFLVMELLSGITLAELVRKAGPRGPAEAAEYMRQIASGLDRAHGWLDREGRSAPIVHRDLKPDNIFLTQRDDGTPLVKILDFGTAKVLSQTTHVSGVLQGTPQYMAYEQAAGDPLTAATDIWSFGLIAFYLLTGHSFWLAVAREGAYAHLFGEVLTLPLPKASQRARELGVTAPFTPEFDAWFGRCVNRNVTQRFPSAGVAAVELARALGVTMRPSSVIDHHAPVPPTLASLAATTPAAPAALAGKLLPELVTLDYTPLTRGPSVRIPRRSLNRYVAAIGGVFLAAGVTAGGLALSRATLPSTADESPANGLSQVPAPNPIARSAGPPTDARELAPTPGEPRLPAVTLVDSPALASSPLPKATASAPHARTPADARAPRPRPRPVVKVPRAEPARPTATAAPRPSTRNVYEDR